MHSRTLVLGLALLVTACKPSSGSTTKPDEGGSDRERGSAEAKGATKQAQPVVFDSEGTPHSAPLTQIALSPDGRAALSRDTAGGVRFWASLDGASEPRLVPIRDPRSMALASDGKGGWVAALVDAAGGARIIAITAEGGMQPLASLPPMAMISEMKVLPGGERLLAVGSDHVVRLYDRQAKQLAELDRAGLRPIQLRLAPSVSGGPTKTSLAEGGVQAFAITAGEFDASGHFAVEVLPLVLGDKSIEIAAERRTILVDGPPTADNPTISPDGRTIVFLQQQRSVSGTWKVHAMQLADGRSTSVDLELVGVQPLIGLLPGGRVLVDDGSGLGRIADLANKRVEVTPLRSSPTINHLASVYAGSVRVAPSTTWLAVHELERDEMTYLGYDSISVTHAGISSEGDRVAWALGDRILVETIADNQAVQVPQPQPMGVRFVEFVDADHLVTLDWSGGAQVIDWRDGEVRSSADIGHNVSMAQLVRREGGEAVMVVRTGLWANPLVMELLPNQQIGERHLIYGSTNWVGVISPSDRPFEDWGVWTVDGSGSLRRFTLALLREGMDTKQMLGPGETLGEGIPEQMIMDVDGRRWWIRTEGVRPRLHRSKGSQDDSLLLPSGFVAMMQASPDGRRIAIVQQRDPGQVVTVYDTDSLQPLWAQPVSTVNGLGWSDDDGELAVAAQFAGGVVFDVGSGEVATSRCGLGFKVVHTPPFAGGFFNQLSVCEL